MKFSATQAFTSLSALQVTEAYADARLYPTFRSAHFGDTPEVLDLSYGADGIDLAVRYKLKVDLPAAAEAFVQADKLTFVEYTTLRHDGSGAFDVAPDHYGHILEAGGEIVTRGQPATRTYNGTITVDLGWAGMMFQDRVERGIADALEEALKLQVPFVEKFVSGS